MIAIPNKPIDPPAHVLIATVARTVIEVGNPNLREAMGPCGKKGALYRVLKDGVPEDESVNGWLGSLIS